MYFPIVHLTVKSILNVDARRYFCPFETSIFIKNLIFLVKGIKSKNTVRLLRDFVLRKSRDVADAPMLKMLFGLVHVAF